MNHSDSSIDSEMVEGQKTAKQLEKEKKKAEEKAAKAEKLRLKQEKQKELEAKAKAKPKGDAAKADKAEKKVSAKYEGKTKPGEKKDVTCDMPDAYSPAYVEAAW